MLEAGLEGVNLGGVHHHRDHDLRVWVEPIAAELAGGLHDGPHLNLVDIRIGQAQATASMAKHGVVLVKCLGCFQQVLLLGQRLRIAAGCAEDGHLLKEIFDHVPVP